LEQAELRSLLLGPSFKPKVEDIPTPQLLLDKGVPEGLLRMVSMSATERYDTLTSLVQHPIHNTALLIAATLRLRDSGGTDGKGTPVMSPLDAVALIAQDSELFEVLAEVVKPFTRIGTVATAVDAAKNDSGAAPSSTGGSESPSTSDIPPPDNANQESQTVIS
jgi:hypothetical protein